MPAGCEASGAISHACESAWSVPAKSVYGLRMAAKKPPKKGEKPQKERFIEAANEAGVDTDAFERAMKKIVPPVRKK